MVYISMLKMRGNVRVGRQVACRRLPSIRIVKGAFLELGNGVVLNSDNRGYHVNMHSPCKILADRPGAKVYIGDHSRIHGTCIHAYENISIGKRCLIAANTQIIDGNGHDLSFPNVENRVNTSGGSRPVVIEDDVWIGANVIVLPGSVIGRGSVIAAGSVVKGTIPPMCVAEGNPIRVIPKEEKEKTP